MVLTKFTGWKAHMDARLDTIVQKLNLLLTKESDMAIDLSALTAEVTRNSDVTASVVQLINNLAAQLAAIPASTDPVTQAALDNLKATLSANDDAIASAVVANTK
jgi:hypothetical protein